MQSINNPKIGMKLGVHSSDLKKGEFRLLVNGNIESLTGDFMQISNEPSTLLCHKLKGYKLIGSYPVPSLSLTFVTIVSDSGESEIGFINDSFPKITPDESYTCSDCNHPTKENTPLELTEQKEYCNYTTLTNTSCLNFSIDHPINMWVKVDDCNVRIYLTDDFNTFRYIDYPDFQKETLLACPKVYSDELDCDKIRVFKKTCYPKITYTDVVAGGENTAGVYQFGFSYADAYSNPITSYFYITNKIDLFDTSNLILEDKKTDYPIAKSIKIHIEDLNTDFDWFNLVVLKTINGVTTPYLIGTYSVTGNEFDYTFAGVDANIKQRLTLEDVTSIKSVYEKGNIIANSNGILMFADVTEPRTVNLQPVFNKLPVYWETVEMNEGDYANPILAANYVSFLRDEVYALSIEPVSKTTKKYPRFHIPGISKTQANQNIYPLTVDDIISNDDVISNSTCDTEVKNKRWEVYNTAVSSGVACDYSPSGSSTISTFVNCYSDIFYEYEGNYYEDFNRTIPTTPSEYPCQGCPTNSVNCTELLYIIFEGGTKLVDEYATPVEPSLPDAPSGLSSPTNISCLTNNNDISNCNSPQTLLLEDAPSGTTELWYSFAATTTAQVINIASPYNITDGNDFTVSLYLSSGGFCSTLTLIETQTSDYGAFLFENLESGSIYYVTVTGTVNVSGSNNYYSICSYPPIPIGFHTEILSNTVRNHCICETQEQTNDNPCTAIPYEWGHMAYWESSELYPCNEEVWGDLSNTPIRHHKFPDCLISPHYKNPSNFTGENLFHSKCKTYPIGLRVDVEDIKRLLNEAVTLNLFTEEGKNDICGYRIYRSSRRGNESIVAKGLLYDVWKYKDNVYKTDKETLYPNYPFNPRNPDPFNLKFKLETQNSGIVPIEHPFIGQNYKNNKYTFLGVNTLFNNPGIGSELKLEFETYGVAEGRYTEVINHAKYQYIGIGAARAAFCFATLEALFDTIAAVNAGGAISAGILSPTASFMWGAAVPNFYYDWLDVIRKIAPITNFAWYHTAIGNYSSFIPPYLPNGTINPHNTVTNGSRRRLINAGNYLKSGVYSVKDGADTLKINNYKREGSVYLNIDGYFPVTDTEDKSRWYPGDSNHACSFLGNSYDDIASFYASIKNLIPNQYGQVDNIEYVDTGYNGTIDWNSEQDTFCIPIFGGDTYICRYGERKQFPFFIQDRVGFPLNSDVLYNELGNVGYPRFFFSYPKGATVSNTNVAIDVSQLYGDVALNNNFRRDFNFSCNEDLNSGLAWLNYAGKGAINISRGLVGFNIIAGAGVAATVDKILKTFNPYDEDAPFQNHNPEVYISGRFFLYSYGEASFIQESNYNVDLRYGVNQREGNFYPNISDIVSWTQPTSTFNLINFDNTHYYNSDYSKPNRENLGFVLPPDFSQEKEDCKSEHSNRLIYSQQDNDNNDRYDGNLVFPPNSYHDFDKSAGKLSIVKGIDNNKVIVIQENQTSIFNAYSTLEADIKAVAVGGGTLFNNNLQQYIKTDLGYGGSQTPAIVSTEFGTFWADNKRGQIFSYLNNIEDITLGENSWWFKEFLPFKILQDFPDVDVTNNYKWFGMSISYDTRLKRILFTKRDHKLRPEFKDQITFNGTDFILNNEIILPTNPIYFCNQSFTIAYSPLFKNFISYQSYTPNYYIANNGYFSSGINYPTSIENTGLWNHLQDYQSNQVFYGNIYPFILEYSTENTLSNTILNNIQWKSDFRRYINQYDNYSVDVSYNKALIYTPYQTSGNLELIKKIKNNQQQSVLYPKLANNSTQILYENIENFRRFSQGLFDISLQNGQPILQYNCEPWQTLNPLSISYAPKYLKNQLRNNYFNIRLINDKYSNYKITHQFSVQTQSKSDI